MTKKWLLLSCVVLLEIFGGAYLLFTYYIKKIYQPKVLGSESVAVIEKKDVTFPEGSKFKYYYQFEPNTIRTDNPSWLPYQATYTIKNDGLNDRFNYSVEKPSNTYRIITLGDSFTFGHFVNTPDSWPEQLEERFKNESLCGAENVEVINLGMVGYDIPYIVERYKTIGAKYHPDLILWFESGSGFIRYNELSKSIIDECYQRKQGDQVAEVTSQQADYQTCWLQAEKQIQDEYGPWAVTLKITDHLDDLFRGVDQQQLYYITLQEYPEDYQFKESWQYWMERYPGVHFAAIVPTLSGDELLPDNHPSAVGHVKIAKSMFEYLRENEHALPNCSERN